MQELNKGMEDEPEELSIARKRVVQPEHEKSLISLKKMLIILAVSCWILPVLSVLITFYTSYQNGIMKKTQGLLEGELRNTSVRIKAGIEDTIADSQKLSYDKYIETDWRKYLRGTKSRSEFYRDVTDIITKNFGYDRKYRMAVIYLTDEPDKLYPNSGAVKSLFTDKVRNVAAEISAQNTSKIFVQVIDGRLFVIRNMYTTSGYRKYATFVLEVITDHLFEELNKSSIYKTAFSIDGSDTRIFISEDMYSEDTNAVMEKIESQSGISEKDGISIITDPNEKYEGYIQVRRGKNFTLTTYLIAEYDEIYSELRVIRIQILVILLVLIPFICIVIYFITRQVNRPISRLVEASREIRAGNIGVQIEGDRRTMPNREFAYLMVSFNKMSSKIKYLFDYAYNEQLARKDAKILALQSQINPHFLNNTLEMMNWQARLAGDVGVSKMIEALSTLLNYSMDRSNKRLISLAEEVRCADAYFYIVSMRFGQRLLVEKDIDQSLLQIQVPQLILQPLLENAVLHGVEQAKRGTIWLKVYKEGKEVILKVLNTGENMTSEVMERVGKILNGQAENEETGGSHISLGIRNVNERIKLMYGDNYGLTIEPYEEKITAATIRIPYPDEEG